MVKEVASKTNDLAGDGTTSATVLAQAIISNGLKNVAAGANPMDLKRGIDKAVSAIIKDINKQAQQVGDSYDKIEQGNSRDTCLFKQFNRIRKKMSICCQCNIKFW